MRSLNCVKNLNEPQNIRDDLKNNKRKTSLEVSLYSQFGIIQSKAIVEEVQNILR